MSGRCFRISLLVMASFFLMAADHGAPKDASHLREPAVITSRHMKADKLGDEVIFTGDVTLKLESMTLTSDRMVVLYDAATKDVREIDAQGNVMVRKDGRVALSNNAVYYRSDEMIIMTGDARIMENENEIGGEKITLYLRDDRSIVEGGKVLLYQDEPPAGGKLR